MPANLEARFGYPDVRQARESRARRSGSRKRKNRAELEAAIAIAAQYDRKVIVERGHRRQELECAVLGNEEPQASMPCEILPFA